MRSPFSASKFSPVSTESPSGKDTEGRGGHREEELTTKTQRTRRWGKTNAEFLCPSSSSPGFQLVYSHFLISPSRESESAVPLSDFSLSAKLWCHSARR